MSSEYRACLSGRLCIKMSGYKVRMSKYQCIKMLGRLDTWTPGCQDVRMSDEIIWRQEAAYWPVYRPGGSVRAEVAPPVRTRCAVWWPLNRIDARAWHSPVPASRPSSRPYNGPAHVATLIKLYGNDISAEARISEILNSECRNRNIWAKIG